MKKLFILILAILININAIPPIKKQKLSDTESFKSLTDFKRHPKSKTCFIEKKSFCGTFPQALIFISEKEEQKLITINIINSILNTVIKNQIIGCEEISKIINHPEQIQVQVPKKEGGYTNINGKLLSTTQYLSYWIFY